MTTDRTEWTPGDDHWLSLHSYPRGFAHHRSGQAHHQRDVATGVQWTARDVHPEISSQWTYHNGKVERKRFSRARAHAKDLPSVDHHSLCAVGFFVSLLRADWRMVVRSGDWLGGPAGREGGKNTTLLCNDRWNCGMSTCGCHMQVETSVGSQAAAAARMDGRAVAVVGEHLSAVDRATVCTVVVWDGLFHRDTSARIIINSCREEVHDNKRSRLLKLFKGVGEGHNHQGADEEG
jgi:hypothetical protein